MSKTGWIILIICLFLAICICAGIFIAGRVASTLFSLWNDSEVSDTVKNYLDLKSPYSDDGTYSVEMKDLKELTIDWISGSVIVELIDGDDIRIMEVADDTIREKDSLRYGVTDGKLRIQACKKNHVGNLPAKQLTVSLPRSLSTGLRKVNINTVSASVSAGDLQLEDLDVNTVSGQVLIRDTVSKDAEMDSVSGDVTLRNCSFGSIRLNSVSGLLSLTGSASKIKTSSVSGSVQLWLDGSKEVRVNTMSGHIALTFYTTPQELKVDTNSALTSIYLSKEASCTVKLESMSGKLLLNMQETGSKQLTLGDGTAEFNIDTVSGDVWVIMQ